MSGARVVLIYNGRELSLAKDPVVAPAGPVVLSITGSRSRTVRIDGQTRRLPAATGVLAMDLTRSTGYHRVEVDGEDYWFATTDAKARLEGIEAMLRDLENLGTGWTGQMMFSDGTGLRDPHVLYGWLDQWADRVLAAARAVLANPHRGQVRVTETSRRGGPGIDVPATLRLIRSDPSRFLEQHSPGSLTVEGVDYVPVRVRTARRRMTLDTIPNRRCVWLVGRLRQLVTEVQVSTDAKEQASRCLLWRNAAEVLLQAPAASALHRVSSLATVHARSPIELSDPRYRLTHAFAEKISSEFGWSPASQPASRLSYVQRSDEIYQRYAAAVAARALGLRQTDPVLGRAQPAFRSVDLELYLDVVPPSRVMQSWRAASARPDASRPDLLLRRVSTGEVAVLDAKYRASGPDASEDSRKEVSAYMALYGIPRIGILYPAIGLPKTVAAHGQAIVEIPVVAPVTDYQPIARAITGLFLQPGYPRQP